MSAETDEEAAEAVDENGQQESEPEADDERPAIDDDERADIDLSDLDLDTEAIEEEAGAASEQADDSPQDDTDKDETEESGAQPALPEGDTWGDQYVTMLALLLGEIAEASDGETNKDAETIEDLARSPPVELDDAVDQWLAESGMGTNISPGKQVALGTAGLALVIVLTETDLAQDAVTDLTDDLNLSL